MTGERLKELRLMAGFSQSYVAMALSLSRESYGKYERGERNPSIETLLACADFYNVSLDYLLGKSELKAAFGSLNLAKQHAIVSLVSCSELAAKIIADVVALDKEALMQDESPHSRRK